MIKIYGVASNGVHIDVSKSLKGAKRYATIHGYKYVTVRYGCGYSAEFIAEKKDNGRWKAP